MLRRNRGDVAFMWNVLWRPLLTASNTHVPCSKYKTGSQLLLLILWLTWDHREKFGFLAFFSPDKPFSKRRVYKHTCHVSRLIRNIERFSILCTSPPFQRAFNAAGVDGPGECAHQSSGWRDATATGQERHHPVKETGLGTSCCTGVNKPQRAKQELLCS